MKLICHYCIQNLLQKWMNFGLSETNLSVCLSCQSKIHKHFAAARVKILKSHSVVENSDGCSEKFQDFSVKNSRKFFSSQLCVSF